MVYIHYSIAVIQVIAIRGLRLLQFKAKLTFIKKKHNRDNDSYPEITEC